jgi:hypothetical protein
VKQLDFGEPFQEIFSDWWLLLRLRLPSRVTDLFDLAEHRGARVRLNCRSTWLALSAFVTTSFLLSERFRRVRVRVRSRGLRELLELDDLGLHVLIDIHIERSVVGVEEVWDRGVLACILVSRNQGDTGILVSSHLGDTSNLVAPHLGETCILVSPHLGDAGILVLTLLCLSLHLDDACFLVSSHLGDTGIMVSPHLGNTGILVSLKLLLRCLRKRRLRLNHCFHFGFHLTVRR